MHTVSSPSGRYVSAVARHALRPSRGGSLGVMIAASALVWTVIAVATDLLG